VGHEQAYAVAVTHFMAPASRDATHASATCRCRIAFRAPARRHDIARANIALGSTPPDCSSQNRFTLVRLRCVPFPPLR